jgi:hypothetical protein
MISNIVEIYEPEGARMYATGTHICSVASLTRYVFNLHKECDVFWQRSNYLLDEDGEWCEKKKLGQHTLAIIMTNISRKSNLSKHDTNHLGVCIARQLNMEAVEPLSGFEVGGLCQKTSHSL